MKITVEISEKDLKDVHRFSGEKKKGPAVQKLLADILMLKRRREQGEKILSGRVRFEFPHYEAQRKIDRRREAKRLSGRSH